MSVSDPQASVIEMLDVGLGEKPVILAVDYHDELVAVVVSVGQRSARYVHQAVFVRVDDDRWDVVVDGPSLFDLVLPGGTTMSTRMLIAEPGIEAVVFSDGIESRNIVDIDRQTSVVQTHWFSDSPNWPDPQFVVCDGKKQEVVLPDVCTRFDYFLDQYMTYATRHSDELFWTWEALSDAVRESPERAWPIVKAAIEAAPEDRVLFYVAAGPLEDLINMHVSFEERINNAARDSEKLQKALTGVWR